MQDCTPGGASHNRCPRGIARPGEYGVGDGIKCEPTGPTLSYTCRAVRLEGAGVPRTRSGPPRLRVRAALLAEVQQRSSDPPRRRLYSTRRYRVAFRRERSSPCQCDAQHSDDRDAPRHVARHQGSGWRLLRLSGRRGRQPSRALPGRRRRRAAPHTSTPKDFGLAHSTECGLAGPPGNQRLRGLGGCVGNTAVVGASITNSDSGSAYIYSA